MDDTLGRVCAPVQGGKEPGCVAYVREKDGMEYALVLQGGKELHVLHKRHRRCIQHNGQLYT